METYNGRRLWVVLTVFSARVKRSAAQDETSDRNCLRNSDVPAECQHTNILLAESPGQSTYQVRSLNLPDDQDQAIEITPAMR